MPRRCKLTDAELLAKCEEARARGRFGQWASAVDELARRLSAKLGPERSFASAASPFEALALAAVRAARRSRRRA
jgi:hypothetical protein